MLRSFYYRWCKWPQWDFHGITIVVVVRVRVTVRIDPTERVRKVTSQSHHQWYQGSYQNLKLGRYTSSPALKELIDTGFIKSSGSRFQYWGTRLLKKWNRIFFFVISLTKRHLFTPSLLALGDVNDRNAETEKIKIVLWDFHGITIMKFLL